MRYVIFGDGRAGGNIAAYLRYLGHEVETVTRAQAEKGQDKCSDVIKNADIVAAAIPDGALQTWYEDWRKTIGDRPAIHFSGATDIPEMTSYHPLYSFPKAIIDMETMARIPFACAEVGPDFAEIFPGAENPHFKLRDDDRAYYHALAVLSGNLSAYLWNKTAKPFENLSGLPAQDIMGVYLQSLVDRFLESPSDSLTGPIARRDANTVHANFDALKNKTELNHLYQAFVTSAWPDYSR